MLFLMFVIYYLFHVVISGSITVKYNYAFASGGQHLLSKTKDTCIHVLTCKLHQYTTVLTSRFFKCDAKHDSRQKAEEQTNCNSYS